MTSLGRVAVLAAFVASLAGVSSCTRRATQMIVVVDSDLVPASIRCVRLVAGQSQPDGSFVATSTSTVFRVGTTVPELPFSFGLLPSSGDAHQHVELRVGAYADCGAADAESDADAATLVAANVTRTVRSGFVEGQAVLVNVFLSSRCAMRACAAAQTCDPDTGTCVDIAFQDPSTLPTVRPGDELRDGGGSADAGGTRPDAGVITCSEVTTTATTGRAMLTTIGVAARGTHVAFGYQYGSNLAGELDGSSTSVDDLGGAIGTAVLGTAITDGGDLGVAYPQVGMGPVLRSTSTGASGTAHAVGTFNGTRPLVADGNTFVVLRGTSTLSVLRVSLTFVDSGPFTVATGATTQTTLLAMSGGFGVGYSDGTTCTVATFDAAGTAAGSTTIADCAAVDGAQRPDGQFALAWIVASDHTVHTGLATATLSSIGDQAEVGTARTGSRLVQVGVLDDGRYRAAWIDPSPAVHTVLMPGWVNERCFVHTGATTMEYDRMRAASHASETILGFPSGTAVYDQRLTD